MKKLAVCLLCIPVLLSLVACSKLTFAIGSQTTQSTTASTATEIGTVSDTTATTAGMTHTSATATTTFSLPLDVFDEMEDFENFADMLDKEGIKFEETETETDNDTVIVDMVIPTKPVAPITRPSYIKPSTKPTQHPTSATTKPTTTPSTAKKPTIPSTTTTQTIPSTTATSRPTTTTTTQPTTTTTKPTAPTKPAAPTYTYTTDQVHKALPYTERYLYSKLDDEWKECYRKIDEAINDLEESVDLNMELSANGGYKIYHLYMFDNPQHFYLQNQVCVHNRGDGNDSLSFYYAVGREKGEYCGYGYASLTDELREKIRAKKAVFDAEVQRIISTIPANAPAVVKEKLIYDRILIDSHYNLSARWDGLANDNWTAYGILVNKYGVCESYSEAFQTLCQAVGINCTGIVGTAGGGHKWNAVQLDGEWYQCDNFGG